MYYFGEKRKKIVSDSRLRGLACDADTDAKLWIAVFPGLRREMRME